MGGCVVEAVSFLSDGIRCAGDLYLPDDIGSGDRRPGLVIGQGFSGTKASLVGQGEFFAKAGYMTLAIDYRSWGESEGEPRGQLFPLWQVEDFRNAISYLEARPEVAADQLGVWGTSFGGGVVIWLAAVDRRVKAVVSQVPVVDGRRWSRALRTTEQWEQLLDRLDADRRHRFAGEPGERVPIMGHGASDDFSAMPTDRSMLDAARALAPPGAPADMTLESVEKVIEFSPIAMIDRIGPRPLLVVTTLGYDIIHPAEHIRDAFTRASEPKRFVGLPYDQMGLYAEPGLTDSLTAATAFLNEYLPVRQAQAVVEVAAS